MKEKVRDYEQEAATRKYLAENRIILDAETAKQGGFRCHECNSPEPVYFISKPLYGLFPAGAYCYPCLIKRCRATRAVPFPLPTDLLDKLKLDMGLQINTPPKKIMPL